MPFVLTAALTPAAAGADTSVKTPSKLPAADTTRHFDRDGKGRCFQRAAEDCPPNTHCNPGPPVEVQCPPAEKTPPKK